jgi:hypothetical protein
MSTNELQLFFRGEESKRQGFEMSFRSLAEELRSIPEVIVQPIKELDIGTGTKAIDGNLVGLMVAMSGAGAVIPTTLTVVRDWLVRQRPAQTLRVKIDDVDIDWSGPSLPKELTDLIGRLRPAS